MKKSEERGGQRRGEEVVDGTKSIVADRILIS